VVLLEATSTLTDEILDLHDWFVGSIFNKAAQTRRSIQCSGRAINEKVRPYARTGQALLMAKEHGADPFASFAPKSGHYIFEPDTLKESALELFMALACRIHKLRKFSFAAK
jgi:hypothetical protein